MELLNLPIFGFKHELVKYSPEILTSTNFNYNLNDDLKITTDIESYSQYLNSGSHSKFPSISGKRHAVVNFSTDMYYLSNTDIPNYFQLFESCGWRRIYEILDTLIIETDEEAVNIEIDTDDGIHLFRIAVENVIMSQSHKNNRRPSTISCIYQEFGVSPRQLEYLISGAMGTVEFSGTIGSPVNVSFSFMGCLDNVVTRQFEDLIVPADFDTALPKTLMNSTVTVNGENIDIIDFKVICGNVLSLFSNIFSKTGFDGSRITDKITTGTMTINPNIDNINTFLNYINEETVLNIRNGRLLLQMKGVQFTSLTDDYSKWSFDVHNKIVIAQEDV